MSQYQITHEVIAAALSNSVGILHPNFASQSPPAPFVALYGSSGGTWRDPLIAELEESQRLGRLSAGRD